MNLKYQFCTEILFCAFSGFQSVNVPRNRLLHVVFVFLLMLTHDLMLAMHMDRVLLPKQTCVKHKCGQSIVAQTNVIL